MSCFVPAGVDAGAVRNLASHTRDHSLPGTKRHYEIESIDVRRRRSCCGNRRPGASRRMPERRSGGGCRGTFRREGPCGTGCGRRLSCRSTHGEQESQGGRGCSHAGAELGAGSIQRAGRKVPAITIRGLPSALHSLRVPQGFLLHLGDVLRRMQSGAYPRPNAHVTCSTATRNRTPQRNATLLSPPLNSRSYPATQPALPTTRCRATHVVGGLGKRRSRTR